MNIGICHKSVWRKGDSVFRATEHRLSRPQKFLLEMLKEEWKNIILLVDSTENIQRLRWERWYRAKLDDKNGLLLGAFAGQCVLNVNGVTPWKKQKQQFGYLVQNGTEIEIKYLFD